MTIPVTHQEQNGVHVITIGEENVSIEEGNIEEVSQKLLDIAVSVPPQIIINMEHVDFFGSSFIETLFRVWNRIKDIEGAYFGIAGLQPYCREIIKVTNLDTVWTIYANVDAAINEVSPQA